MGDDLVPRLRSAAALKCAPYEELLLEAATEIEKLRKSWATDVGKILRNVMTNKEIIDDVKRRLDRAGL